MVEIAREEKKRKRKKMAQHDYVLSLEIRIEAKRREFNALDMTRNTKYIAFALQKTTIQIYVIVSNIENVVCSVVIFNGNVVVNMAR